MFGVHVVETSWGYFAYAADEAGLLATWMPCPAKARLNKSISSSSPATSTLSPRLASFEEQICDYFDGRPVVFDVGLNLRKRTPFQSRVLRDCAKIPYGKTMSYGELAKRVGSPGGARAVGGCMGRNPIPIVVPCHRVVGSGGSIGGFSADEGVKLKRRLLELEGAW